LKLVKSLKKIEGHGWTVNEDLFSDPASVLPKDFWNILFRLSGRIPSLAAVLHFANFQAIIAPFSVVHGRRRNCLACRWSPARCWRVLCCRGFGVRLRIDAFPASVSFRCHIFRNLVERVHDRFNGPACSVLVDRRVEKVALEHFRGLFPEHVAKSLRVIVIPPFCRAS